MKRKTRTRRELRPDLVRYIAAKDGALPSDEEAEYDEKAHVRAPFGWLLLITKPEWTILIAAFLLQAALEVTTLYTPRLVARAFDIVDDEGSESEDRMKEINELMLVVVLVNFSGLAGFFIQWALTNVAGERTINRLRNKLFWNLLSQDITFFDQNKIGVLTSRMGSDISILQRVVTTVFPQLISHATKILVCMLMMFLISPTLSTIALAALTVLFAITYPFRFLLTRQTKQYQDVLSKTQDVATESFGNIRTIQCFNAEFKTMDRYKGLVGDPDASWMWLPSKYSYQTQTEQQTLYDVGFYRGLAKSGFHALAGGGLLVVYMTLWYGFKLVNEDSITIGELTAFQVYIFIIASCIESTSGRLSKLFEAFGVKDSLYFYLTRKPNIDVEEGETTHHTVIDMSSRSGRDFDFKDQIDQADQTETDYGYGDSQDPVEGEDSEVGYLLTPNATDPEATEIEPKPKKEKKKPKIEFKRVYFAYPTRPDAPVLQDFSLKIEPETTVAFIGGSGSGKSTCVSLLQRLYEPACGKIYIDGVNIKKMDIHSLRSKFGFVPQDATLFYGTIRENICFGLPHAVPQSRIEYVCKLANAHNFISRFPDGYDTMIGERGISLSGGQRQRIAIARALVTDPEILVFDEATSALDSISETVVQQAISRAVVGRTVIIIAHQLSAIKNSDQVVVFNSETRRVSSGRRLSLYARSSGFRSLVDSQNLDMSAFGASDTSTESSRSLDIEDAFQLEPES